MSRQYFLAFDLGAESGRTILGTLENEIISIRELHRFPNAPLSLFGHLHWNIFNLFENIEKGMKICASEITARLESLAVDTWGVDFGLLAGDGSILGLPYAYRDPRNVQAMKKFLEIFPKERIYELTGIQFMPFNSLFQLYALVIDNSPFLKSATDLLFMPDLFTYLLTGVKTTEATIASTSQLYNPRQGSWNEELFSASASPDPSCKALSVPARSSHQSCPPCPRRRASVTSPRSPRPATTRVQPSPPSPLSARIGLTSAPGPGP